MGNVPIRDVASKYWIFSIRESGVPIRDVAFTNHNLVSGLDHRIVVAAFLAR
jgi:hypothetical protein